MCVRKTLDAILAPCQLENDHPTIIYPNYMSNLYVFQGKIATLLSKTFVFRI